MKLIFEVICQSWRYGGSIISQPWSRPALRFLHTKTQWSFQAPLRFEVAGIKTKWNDAWCFINYYGVAIILLLGYWSRPKSHVD